MLGGHRHLNVYRFTYQLRIRTEAVNDTVSSLLQSAACHFTTEEQT